MCNRDTVLISGCAGYIGSSLVQHLLNSGAKVIGVDNLIYKNGQSLFPYLSNPKFEFYNLDIRKPEFLSLLPKAGTIIHLAALVGAPICKKYEYDAASINYSFVNRMVKNLSKDQRLIFPNTNSGYGQSDGKEALTEDAPLNPISIYGRTKCDAEKRVLSHPNSVSLRLATVFGPSPRMRFDLMVNDFTKTLVQKKKLEIFEPHFLRNYVGILDVCRAFMHFATRPWWQGVYNLGLPTANLTKLELAHKICDTINLSREVVTIGDGEDVDKRNYLISNDKVLSTGFKFIHSLEDGIKQVATIVKNVPESELLKMSNV